jgi:hypothetical protein
VASAGRSAMDGTSSAGMSSSTDMTSASMPAQANTQSSHPRDLVDAGAPEVLPDAMVTSDDVSNIPRCIAPPAIPTGADCSPRTEGTQCKYGLGNEGYGVCTCTAMNGAKRWVCSH